MCTFLSVLILCGDVFGRSLSEMIGTADLIVIGAVESVGENMFHLSVEATILGDYADKSIKVKHLKSGNRWTPMRSGQRLLLFLMKGEYDWTLVSRRAEIPIVEDRACVPIKLNSWPTSEQDAFGAPLRCHQVPLPEFRDAIEQHRQAFTFFDSEGHLSAVRIECEDIRLAELEDRSPTLAALVDESLELRRQFIRAWEFRCTNASRALSQGRSQAALNELKLAMQNAQCFAPRSHRITATARMYAELLRRIQRPDEAEAVEREFLRPP